MLVRSPFDATYWTPNGRRRFHQPSCWRVVALGARAQAILALLVAPLMTFIAFPLLIGSAPWPSGSDRALVVSFGMALTLATILLGVVHEATHYIAAKLTAAQMISVYSDGLRVGISYRTRRPLHTVLITLAGPMTAVGIGLISMWGVVTMAPSDAQPPTRPILVALVAVMIYHLSCLAPTAADGRTLWTALKRARSRRTLKERG